MNDALSTRLSEWTEQIDSRLKELVEKSIYPDEFKEILNYALFPGGKRLRPILLLEWHSLFAPPDDEAITYACGLELVHSYSLVHDDMPCMDDDDVRRGKPAVHKKYGEAKALLAGDALMDLGYRAMYKPTADGRTSPLLLFAAHCGDYGLIHGQYLDLFCDIKSPDGLLEMYEKKTGGLIAMACMSGYALGKNMSYADGDRVLDRLCENIWGGKPNITDGDENNVLGEFVAATKFAAEFGRAFQLYDDISEYIAGEGIADTSIMNFMELDAAKQFLNVKLNNAARALEDVDGKTEYLLALLEKFVIA